MRKWLKIKVLRISSFFLPYLCRIKEDDMKNDLLDKGIILPSGEINKDKINLVAGAIS